MTYDIETYKGQLIQYNDDTDRFVSEMATGNAYQMKERKSLIEVRKTIDQFLKLNLDFKPFKVMTENGDVLKFTSIRTDGKFIDSQNSQWTRDQVLSGSNYSRRFEGVKAFYHDPDIEASLKELARQRKISNEAFDNEHERQVSNLKPLPEDFLSQYTL